MSIQAHDQRALRVTSEPSPLVVGPLIQPVREGVGVDLQNEHAVEDIEEGVDVP